MTKFKSVYPLVTGRQTPFQKYYSCRIADMDVANIYNQPSTNRYNSPLLNPINIKQEEYPQKKIYTFVEPGTQNLGRPD